MPAILNGVEYETLNEAMKVAKDGEVIECRGLTTVHDDFDVEMHDMDALPPLFACKDACKSTPYGIRWMRID